MILRPCPWDPKLSGPLPAASHGDGQLRPGYSQPCLQGAGTTCTIAFATVAIGAVVGTVLGALTGYFGGLVDEVLMRVNDVLTAFPSILLALVVISLLGPGKKYNVMVALGLVFIPSFARVTRTAFASLRDVNYVKGARLMGASPRRILVVHMLPNTTSSPAACPYHRLQQRRAGGGVHELSGHRCHAAGRVSGVHALRGTEPALPPRPGTRWARALPSCCWSSAPV